MVRVRFAPSPTGRLHVGGARCALFNYLYAKGTDGVFVLRIEDTDVKRSSREYLDNILEGLKWLGIEWDEGPYFQSERLPEYRKEAERLLQGGYAYRDPDGSAALRFRMPNERIEWDDLIHGKISWDCSIIDDFVMMKSDGTPTYNFACVVDDEAFGITHIIRGDDHISNTPKQIALYRALGHRIPKFAHIPLIYGSDKRRLSKRHGAKSILEYRDEGILSDALFNFLTLLSWSGGDDRELLSRNEIERKFSLKRVKKTPAVFDYEKLLWLNQQYIKKMGEDELASALKSFLPEVKRNDDFWIALARLYRVRLKKLSDIREKAAFFFGEVEYDEEAVNRYLSNTNMRNRTLRTIFEQLKSLPEWNKTALETTIRNYAHQLGREPKELIHPLRVAITGGTASPGLFETMELLGRKTVLQRLEKWV